MQGMQGILGTRRGDEIIATFANTDTPKVRDVYYGFEHFTSYREDDQKTKKMLVGVLGNAGVKKVTIRPCDILSRAGRRDFWLIPRATMTT